LSDFNQIWYIDSVCQEKEQVLSVMQLQGVIYAHERNLMFLANLLKLPLNVGLQVK